MIKLWQHLLQRTTRGTNTATYINVNECCVGTVCVFLHICSQRLWLDTFAGVRGQSDDSRRLYASVLIRGPP